MEPIHPDELEHILDHFALGGEIVGITLISTGHINDTFVSQVRSATGMRRYVHQRINHHVFHQPEQVMENIVRVTEHARRQIALEGGDTQRQTLRLVPVRGGEWFYRTPAGDTWRTYHGIDGARTYEVPEHPDQVYHAARAFGRFQKLLSTLPGERLHETIPDFHHTPKRLAALLRVVQDDPCGRVAKARPEISFILEREADVSLAVDLMAQGALPERVIHNDTKLNNVLIDDCSGEGICVLDLDTVMPGTVLYDFGDMVRAGAATAAEDEPDLGKVGLDLGLFERLASGYAETARDFLTRLEWDLLSQAGRLITLEQGIRFLTDYLQGDTYYRTHRPGQNLDRARTQLKLVAEMEGHQDEMQAIIRACQT
jgi:hypothetical protein